MGLFSTPGRRSAGACPPSERGSNRWSSLFSVVFRLRGHNASNRQEQHVVAATKIRVSGDDMDETSNRSEKKTKSSSVVFATKGMLATLRAGVKSLRMATGKTTTSTKVAEKKNNSMTVTDKGTELTPDQEYFAKCCKLEWLGNELQSYKESLDSHRATLLLLKSQAGSLDQYKERIAAVKLQISQKKLDIRVKQREIAQMDAEIAKELDYVSC